MMKCCLQMLCVATISVVFIITGIFLRKYEIHSLTFNELKLALGKYPITRFHASNGVMDPPCSQHHDIYVCSGYCPWANNYNKGLVSCLFLPRILYPDFVKYNVYCIPDVDQCPNYNAWLKDHLPQTRQHIKRIPDNLLSNFTLNFSIPVDYEHQQFRSDVTFPVTWTTEFIGKYRSQVRARVPFGTYGNKDIYPALDKYASLAIKSKRCAVIGTENPWIEAALLEYSASSVTTIEYAVIHSSVPRLFTITPMAFAHEQQNDRSKRQLFDSVWSYSSLEHDGLGRYQDPLNPYGDLQTMVKISCILKPGGFLFLSVPLSIRDFLQFNVHRIYGPIRLPFVYRNFHIVEVLGGKMSRVKGDHGVQPFVVLQNKLGCKTSP
jgi:hypothetical protein